MKKIIVFVLLMYMIMPLMAQTKYFTKNYGWSDIHSGRDVNYIADNYYWLCGSFADSEVTKINSFCFQFNNNGDTLNLKTYYIDDYETIIQSSLQKKNGYLLVGDARKISTQKIASYSIMLDFDFNILSFNGLGDVIYNNRTLSATQTTDGGYLLAGEIWSDPIDVNSFYSNPYLIKLDSLGNEVWNKIYPYPYFSWFREIKVSPQGDGYYLIGTIEYRYEHGDILLLKIDEEGEVIWERTFNLGYEDWGIKMNFTMDGGFLLSGHSGLPINYGTIIKLNKHTFEEWRKDDELFFNGTVTGLVELSDSTIIVSGHASDYYLSGQTSTDFEVMIAKLSPKGEVLWSRHYGGNRNDLGYDLVLTNERADGLDGFIISGRTESLPEPGANVYLVKTNCMGLLTEPLTSFSAEQDPENPLTYHFTNHSEYVYPDSIDGGHFLWDFGDGATSEELHPSHTFAEKGESRIVTLTAIVCSDTSRFDIKVVTGEEIVGIEGVDGLPAFSFKMYPNPTSSGQVFLEYDLPKEGLLQLYDLQGKEVGNWILGIRYSQVDLDLGDFVEGMYLYRLTCGGAFLKGGKLVVE
ncbi:MAG: T9SS type A sorting domain-containing protein [Chitinophagales bacterium]